RPVSPAAFQRYGFDIFWAYRVYTALGDAIPIIRNEELILLRAEAYIGQGSNLAAAVADLNFIRVNSGGLAPYAGLVTQPALLNELLYDKRYSLLFEGGHRWIDVRRYNRLLTDLPQEATTDLGTTTRFSKMPFPVDECNPRAPMPAGCGTEPGF
ncbi:MAG: RagB/SusD family nutrient uptake outer membrane protein, partial [Gemmatimonadales bacterium]